MTSTNGSDTLYKNQQAHILKLITQSFCKVLAKYGLAKKDIVTVSIQLLDYVIDHPVTPAPGAFSHSPAVQPASIDNRWLATTF